LLTFALLCLVSLSRFAMGAVAPNMEGTEVPVVMTSDSQGLQAKMPGALLPLGASASMPADASRSAEAKARIQAVSQALRRVFTQANQGERAQASDDTERSIAPRLLERTRGIDVRLREGARTPRVMRAETLQAAEQGPWNDEERGKRTARAFLRDHRQALRLRDPDKEMRLDVDQADELGHRHIRFQQVYRDLPVWANELIVQLDPKGNVITMHGAYSPTPGGKLITRPALDAEAALVKARAAIEGADKASASPPELLIHAPLQGVSRLAWKIELNVSTKSRWLVFVDAATGKVLETQSLVCEAAALGSGLDLFSVTRSLDVWKNGATYLMIDTSKDMYDVTSAPPNMEQTRGAIFILDAANKAPDSSGNISLSIVSSTNPNSWTVKDGVSASYNLSLTYDYYRDVHSRLSLDGEGGSLYAVVRFREKADTPLANAFWNGSYMVFGTAKPYAGATDVVGHELTHGVVEKTASLVYKNQPGALNEALADIFGEMVEARSKGGQPDWLIGGPPLAPAEDALRDFINPNNVSCYLAACPAKMSEFINTTLDNGGVHMNSSIINHAYYLLAQGLPGAIGIADAERVFYRALTTKLTPYSEFIDARHAAIDSAKELFGAASTQATKVAAAFDAVEIVDAPETPESPDTPAVSGTDASLFNFYFPGSGFYLARRETPDDVAVGGIFLSYYPISPARSSVTGDGSIGMFVDSANDVCAVYTNATQPESCLGFAGLAHSVAVARDQTKVAFVLLDAYGYPDNNITIYDLITEDIVAFPLVAPVLDGGTVNVLMADVMEFTGDSKGLVYDAYNELTLKNGQKIGLWSIYRLDLETGQVVTIVPPIEGIDIANPSLGKTSDHRLLFEVIDGAANVTTVYAANTFTGIASEVITMAPGPLLAAPSFTGDDTALVFAYPNGSAYTGSSCWRQGLAADHLTPTGAATLWVPDGAQCVVYRRGTYTPPQYYKLTVSKSGTGSGLVSGVPSGISCGAACSASYLKGTSVTLTAQASDGSVFAGWSGAADCADGVVTMGANKSCVATFNLDAAKPTVTVTAPDKIATEAGATTGKFVISRTGSTAAALTVAYTVSGSATSGADYSSLGGSVTIPVGKASVAKLVKPLQDTLQEGDETVVLTLKSSANYALGGADSATVTIVSDDTVTQTVTITATDNYATESGPTTGKFTISRVGDTSAALTVNYVVSGTATAVSDYKALGTSVVIPAGSASVVKIVTPVDDSLQELDESIVVTLAESATYAVGGGGSATVVLASDEAVTQTVNVAAADGTSTEAGLTNGKFTFTRSGDTSAALTVNYAVTGTATSGVDYTSLGGGVNFPAGVTSVSKLVKPLQDTLVEANETVVLTLKQSANYAVGPNAKATVILTSDD
jgi:Zn-dependent metalloprotease